MRVSVRSSSGTLVARADAGVGWVAGALKLCIGGWYVPKSSRRAFRCDDNREPAKGVARSCGNRGLDEYIYSKCQRSTYVQWCDEYAQARLLTPDDRSPTRDLLLFPRLAEKADGSVQMI